MSRQGVSSSSVAAFRRDVWAHYRESGRHNLPWRTTRNPYHILVSEVMLQQTQVPRVVGKYKEFLKKYPTLRSLAKSNLKEVLKVWSGLGYNRRAKYLHESAKMIVTKYRGSIKNATASAKLPGVGAYTNAALRIFAFNEPVTMLETNIRAAYIHYFFPKAKAVSDRDLTPFVEMAARGQDPREWHSALMDFGAHMKKLHENPTARSASYVMQSKFEGSLRQVRGEILRLLGAGSYGDLALAKTLTHDERRVREALRGLMKDGLVVSEKGSWRIA